ncbi:NIPSNAP family protein [Bordetella genomosp. 9]|uniref:NIPSNAP family protein n=2 Tax=Bordetella TaxID=517 RepID=A0A261R5I0_9BORD|nr:MULTISPECIES: NIPSNAP family protein [Bordetella]ARP83383.1 NIPSNAP family protein [Bordetella genomosp. 8]OZI20201.1 NIPSNAP family protein [Bordetella genomosp. 9]
MLIELRRYTIVPGKLKEYLSLYQERGFPAQRKHVGEPVGYFISEIGTVNQVVHLWKYEDFADRQARRAAMEADPDWQAYKKLTAAGAYIQLQESQLLNPAPWSKI